MCRTMLDAMSLNERALLEAEVVVRHEGCAVAECLTDGASAAQVSADRDADIIVMHGTGEAQVQRFYESLVATQDRPPAIVARTPTSIVVRGRNPEWGVVSTILQTGATILWPAIWRDGYERYTVVVADRAQLTRLVDALQKQGPTKVERVRDVPADALSISVPLAGLLSGLTARQLEALQLAISEGYYATPRGTSSEAMAASLGISRSTFEEHLRKAELRALQHFAAAVAAHPALAALPRRGAGRPKVYT